MNLKVYNGQCECGCGKQTSILKYDDPASGRKAGQHRRFLPGHYHRHMRALGKYTGDQYSRLKLIEQRRHDLVIAVLDSGGKTSLEEIAKTVAPEFALEGCSMMINSARKWELLGRITS
jgi:hypothetical protein